MRGYFYAPSSLEKITPKSAPTIITSLLVVKNALNRSVTVVGCLCMVN
jgi:hypothetical protein